MELVVGGASNGCPNIMLVIFLQGLVDSEVVY